MPAPLPEEGALGRFLYVLSATIIAMIIVAIILIIIIIPIWNIFCKSKKGWKNRFHNERSGSELPASRTVFLFLKLPITYYSKPNML